ncbi:MAG: hypothetical protein KAI97_08475 [Gemmatimonadetes bacterium]|nr:hypothetical protein [Gemmatimonadota bacterium]
MLTRIHRCPVFQLRPTVTHGNRSLLDAGQSGIRVPQGLSGDDVRQPTYITPERMLSLLRSQQQSGNRLGVVHGLTKAHFSLRFSDVGRQWRRVEMGHSRAAWVFQGGDIFFDICIDVFVLEGDRPQGNDSISRQIFAVIMQHELEHVADEIDIIRRWMPPRAYRDRMVRSYLADARPVTDRMFRNWFRTRQFEDWLRMGLWAPEHNRRKASRDSPENYRALQEEIDQLRIRATNRP